MTDPIQFPNLAPLGPLQRPGSSAPTSVDGASAEPTKFSDILVESLDEVKRLQDEAAAGVNRILAGDTKNPDEVFSAIQKAGVAFSLLMEIRNKLVDAYDELKEMRV